MHGDIGTRRATVTGQSSRGWRNLDGFDLTAERGQSFRQNADRTAGLKAPLVTIMSERAENGRVPAEFVGTRCKAPGVGTLLIFLFKESPAAGIHHADAKTSN